MNIQTVTHNEHTNRHTQWTYKPSHAMNIQTVTRNENMCVYVCIYMHGIYKCDTQTKRIQSDPLRGMQQMYVCIYIIHVYIKYMYIYNTCIYIMYVTRDHLCVYTCTWDLYMWHANQTYPKWPITWHATNICVYIYNTCIYIIYVTRDHLCVYIRT